MRFLSLTAPAAIAIALASVSTASPTPSTRAAKPPAAKFGMGKTPVRGVNLGGWFVLENWITPSFFLAGDLANKNVPDEWNYMTMSANASVAKANLKQHWATWYTEDDFAQIAAAGLNTVRLPLPHWAFNASSSEPYQGVAQRPYIRQALLWAKQYGLDVVLDLHTVPGSQNGYDNSGHAGPIQFSQKSTDIPRTLDVLTKMVDWYCNNASYGGVVKAIEIVNEPKRGSGAVPVKTLNSFRKQAYNAILGAVKSTALVTPTVLISNEFVDVADSWDSLFPTSTYKAGTFVVDEHHYQAWTPWQGQSFDTQIQWFCGTSGNPYAGHLLDQAKKRPTLVGEWSLGVSIGCTPYTDCRGRTMADDIADHSSAAENNFYRRFFEAQVSVYEQGAGWIFWAWKTEAVSTWSFKDARGQGWIPSDVSDVSERAFVPSTTKGVCASKNPSRQLSFPPN